MEVEKIDRINALAHKAKSVGLTEEEKKERELLRKEYIASVRMNLRAQLDNVDEGEECCKRCRNPDYGRCSFLCGTGFCRRMGWKR